MAAKKVVGYIRVSTQIQATEGDSLNLQEKQIKDLVKFKGWELTGIYKDAGRSGGNTERPGLKSLLEK